MNKTVLIADPDVSLREKVAEKLTGDQLGALHAELGRDALLTARESQPDLVLAELILPDITGLSLCRQIREDPRTESIPVVVMSHHAGEMDRIISFEIGVDDFVAKPFSANELAARLRAILRRPRTQIEPPPALDAAPTPSTHLANSIQVAGAVVDATHRELQILQELQREEGRVVRREELLRRLWPPEASATPRTIDAHIKSLRRKLGEARNCIHTVRGAGYRYEEMERKE